MKILQNFKKANGITLVALVVTIVVLLILAGVSLNLVLGENGIIAKARDARNVTAQDALDTQTALNSLYDEMEAAINGGSAGGNGGSGENSGVVENPYEGQDAANSWEIGLNNPKDVIAYLYLKENGDYDLVVRGTGTGEMMSFGEAEGHCGAWNTTIFSDYALENVYITTGVTNIGNVMFNHLSLNEVHIANTVTTIGDGAFSFSTILNDIIIPESVKYIGKSAFCNCNANIEILGSVTLGEGAFRDYDKSNEIILTSITISDSATSIEDYAFSGCTSLTDITIPDSVTSIGIHAFYNTAWDNNQLDGEVYAGKVFYKYKGTMPSNTKINIIEGTKGIAAQAFYNCTRLASITIPDSVTSIGYSAFSGCTSLTHVYYAGSIDDWRAITIKQYNDPLTHATIHYNSTGPDSNS